MLKICPLCRQTWSGGRDCPKCGEGQPLIDVAGEQGRRTFLRDRELAGAIRGYYGARSGMLVAFLGMLVGIVVALLCGLKASVSHQPLWYLAGLLSAFLPIAVAVLAGDRIVRRFSRGCLGRAPGPADIRIGRKDDSRKDLLSFGQRG